MGGEACHAEAHQKLEDEVEEVWRGLGSNHGLNGVRKISPCVLGGQMRVAR